MTAEMNSLVNDPDFVVEFAMGDPTPDLVAQERGSGITFSGLYFDKPKRYLMKKAHMSKEDVRIFDTDTGKLVSFVSFESFNRWWGARTCSVCASRMDSDEAGVFHEYIHF